MCNSRENGRIDRSRHHRNGNCRFPPPPCGLHDLILPDGTYDVVIRRVTLGAGLPWPRLVVMFEVEHGPRAGARFRRTYPLVANASWKLEKLIALVGIGSPFGSRHGVRRVAFDTDDLLGARIRMIARATVNDVDGASRTAFEEVSR